MKKIISIVMAMLLSVSVVLLVACNNQSKEEKEQDEISQKIEEKQTFYEDVFDDTSKIEFNSKNISYCSKPVNTNELTNIDISENGDFKISVDLSKSTRYINYQIGKERYLEIHTPEFENKVNGNKKTPAEDLYFVITGLDDTSSTPAALGASYEDLEKKVKISKENITSVKYLSTKEVKGCVCDRVEVVYNDDSNKNTKNPLTNSAIFYFKESDNKLFGAQIEDTNNVVTVYLKDSIEIKLPDADFVKTDKETIEEKMNNLALAMISKTEVSQ